MTGNLGSMIVGLLFATTMAHNQPLGTVHVVDTVDTGVLRFLVKGPCTSDILTEFAVLAEAVARYSKATGTTNRYPQDFITTGAPTSEPNEQGSGGWPGNYGYNNNSGIIGGLDDGIRLNHLTVAVECCDGELSGDIEAGFGFYPCHDRMVPLSWKGDLPSTQELYKATGHSMGWVTSSATQNHM